MFKYCTLHQPAYISCILTVNTVRENPLKILGQGISSRYNSVAHCNSPNVTWASRVVSLVVLDDRHVLTEEQEKVLAHNYTTQTFTPNTYV
jgi:hypothetical protein